MMHILPQTRDEKLAMYMKLTKREMAEMLVNANEVIDRAYGQPVPGNVPNRAEILRDPFVFPWEMTENPLFRL